MVFYYFITIFIVDFLFGSYLLQKFVLYHTRGLKFVYQTDHRHLLRNPRHLNIPVVLVPCMVGHQQVFQLVALAILVHLVGVVVVVLVAAAALAVLEPELL
jgi:hypothetical protein